MFAVAWINKKTTKLNETLFPVFGCECFMFLNFFSHNTQDNVCNPSFYCATALFLFVFPPSLFMWILYYDVSDIHIRIIFYRILFCTSFLVTFRFEFKVNLGVLDKSLDIFRLSHIMIIHKENGTRASVFNRHRICVTGILRNIIVWYNLDSIGPF